MIDYGNSRCVGVMAGCMSWGCTREIGGQHTELPLTVVCCGGIWKRIVESIGHWRDITKKKPGPKPNEAN